MHHGPVYQNPSHQPSTPKRFLPYPQARRDYLQVDTSLQGQLSGCLAPNLLSVSHPIQEKCIHHLWKAHNHPTGSFFHLPLLLLVPIHRRWADANPPSEHTYHIHANQQTQ